MSRQAQSLFVHTVIAAAEITANRFILPAGTLSGLAGDAIGVARFAGALGDAIATDVIGTAIIETGGVFASGALLQSDASGRAIAATATAVKSAVIDGGAAGALVLTGIKAGDRLIGVARLNRDATAANVDLDDLTAEFSVTAADEISNTGGTATTGDALLVTWQTTNPVKARALQASTGAGQFVEALLLHAA